MVGTLFGYLGKYTVVSLFLSYLVVILSKSSFPFNYEIHLEMFQNGAIALVFTVLLIIYIMIYSAMIEKYEHDTAYNIAYVFAFREEADKAFEWLQKAVTYNDTGLSEIVTETLFDNVRSDDRWLTFLESIGKSPEQLAAIEFNLSLPD